MATALKGTSTVLAIFPSWLSENVGSPDRRRDPSLALAFLDRPTQKANRESMTHVRRVH